jgi:hypothetical protein
VVKIHGEHFFSKKMEEYALRREKEYAPKRFDQTFFKFDTWCKSMEGLRTNAPRRGAYKYLKK